MIWEGKDGIGCSQLHSSETTPTTGESLKTANKGTPCVLSWCIYMHGVLLE